MPEPTDKTARLAALIKEKTAAGLSEDQARKVAEAQIAHDDALAAKAKTETDSKEPESDPNKKPKK